MQDFAQVLVSALEHAAGEQPREACGLVVARDGGRFYHPARNQAEGLEHFVIDPDDYAAAEDEGAIVAIAHSHVNRPPTPSEADRVGCERTGLPWLIVNWPLGTWEVLQPAGYVAPYVGREFVHGVLDCYGLVRDWYAREMAIDLPDMPREWEWWLKGGNLYRDNFAKHGFVEVTGIPQRGDGFLMRLRSPVENHAAIYEGAGRILQHLQGRLSSRDVYGGYWQRHTTAHLRHRSQM